MELDEEGSIVVPG